MLDVPAMTDPVDDFRKRVERFLKRTGMKKTVLGSEVISDPTFVDKMRDGREPRFSTMRKFDDFMRDYKG